MKPTGESASDSGLPSQPPELPKGDGGQEVAGLPGKPSPQVEPLGVPLVSSGMLGMLDRLLRDRDSLLDEIFEGKGVASRLRMFLVATVALLAFYGFSMGLMGFRQSISLGLFQMLASAVKVPLLFLLSTAVCFPVLYIVQVLMGARLAFSQTLALILMALTLNGVLLASCAPIVFFFAVTGSSHDFMKLLHVFILGFAGVWSMMSLWLGLRTMCEKSSLYPPIAVRILKVWILVFAFVGTQMTWSLRPFVGTAGMPELTVFRQQEGNFYAGVWGSLVRMGKRVADED